MTLDSTSGAPILPRPPSCVRGGTTILSVSTSSQAAMKDECAGRDDVILLYGAGDREVNHAVVLERILTELAN